MSAPHSCTTSSGARLRMLRAAVFAAVCVVLSGAGHAVASCAAVPFWALGAGFLAVLAATAPLAGRERSLPGIVALLAAGQAVLHTLFGLGQHGTTVVTQGTGDAAVVARAARLLCGTTAAALSPAQAHRILSDARLLPAGGSGTGSLPAHGPAGTLAGPGGLLPSSPALLLPSLPMLLGHVLAALAAGWLLRHGDLALLRLVRLSAHGVAEGALMRSLRGALALVRTLYSGLGNTPEVRPRTSRAALLTPPGPRTAALQHSVIRRGPPAAAHRLAA